jgi:predicted PurR-regulated permease PerM
MRQLAWYTVVILLILSAMILLWQFRQAMVMFVLSVATAAAFRPLINFLAARRLSRNLALFLAYLLVILAILALLFAIVGHFLNDVQQAADDFANAYTRIKTEWPDRGTRFQQSLVEQLPAPERLFDALAGERGLQAAQAFLGVASGLLQVVSALGIILILSMYWSADRVRFERLWLSLLPVEQRARARDVWRAIEQGVGAYIAGEAVQSVLAALLLWLGYWSMGLPYPALLAVAGALAWLIPWLGAVLAVIPPLIVGLAISPDLAALAAIYTLMVLFVMEVVVEPRFFPRPQYSSLLLVLVVISLAITFGLVGVLLAPPLAAAIQIFANQYAQLRGLVGPLPDLKQAGPPAEPLSVPGSGIAGHTKVEPARQPKLEPAGLPGELPGMNQNLAGSALPPGLQDQAGPVISGHADRTPELQVIPTSAENKTRQLAAIKQRLAEVKELLSKEEPGPPPELSNLVERLSALVVRAEAYLEERVISESG